MSANRLIVAQTPQQKMMARNKMQQWQDALDDLIESQPSTNYLYRQKQREKASAGSELFHKQPTHQRVSESGRKIIPEALYNKLIEPVTKAGGLVIRGEEAEKHLGQNFASHIGGILFFRSDATISDVLEETYHFKQEKRGDYANDPLPVRICKIEIDAKKYLLSVAERYKISTEETELTQRELQYYQDELAKLEGR